MIGYLKKKKNEGILRMISSLILASFLFTTFAAPYAQASLWEERKQLASAKMSAGLSAWDGAALSPAKLEAGLSELEKTPLRVQPSAQARARVSGKYPQLPPQLWSKIAPFASVERVYSAPGQSLSWAGGDLKASRPIILHVQDVHSLFSVQKNLAFLIREFAQSGAGVVGVEGAVDRLEGLETWKRFPDREAVQKVAGYLLKTGLFTGVEVAGLAPESDRAEFYGVEEKESYDAQVKSFRDAFAKNEAISRWQSAFSERLAALKHRYYGAGLADLDAKKDAFDRRAIRLGEWTAALSDNMPLASYPNVRKFLETQKTEKDLNFSKISEDQKKLMKELSGKLDKSGLTDLLQSSLMFRLGHMSHAEFYAELQGICGRAGISLSSDMARYVRYVAQVEGIGHQELFDELVRLEAAAFDASAGRGVAQTLARIDADFRLLKKGLDFSLTPSEWARTAARENELARLEERLQSLEGARSREKDFDAVAQASALVRRFNELSEQRNQIFIEKLTRRMAEKKSNVSVLVAGGYHTAGMEELMKRRGVSFITLRPRIAAGDLSAAGKPMDAFTRQLLPLEQLFQSEKVSIKTGSAQDAQVGPQASYAAAEQALSALAPLAAIASPDRIVTLKQVREFFAQLGKNVILADGEESIEPTTSNGRELYTIRVRFPDSDQVVIASVWTERNSELSRALAADPIAALSAEGVLSAQDVTLAVAGDLENVFRAGDAHPMGIALQRPTLARRAGATLRNAGREALRTVKAVSAYDYGRDWSNLAHMRSNPALAFNSGIRLALFVGFLGLAAYTGTMFLMGTTQAVEEPQKPTFEQFMADPAYSEAAQWIRSTADLTGVENFELIDESDDERLLREAIAAGEIIDLGDGTYYARSHPLDTARTVDRTFVATDDPRDAGIFNNWAKSDEIRPKVEDLMRGASRGKTMYVIPYIMGPAGSPLEKWGTGIELTDNRYVALSMIRMARTGRQALDAIREQNTFVKGVHVTGDLDRLKQGTNEDMRHFVTFAETREILHFGSAYGGNALLAKIAHGLRLAIFDGVRNSKKDPSNPFMVVSQMGLMEIEDLKTGEKTYAVVGFPSASGKTNLVMMNTPEVLEDRYKVRFLGDDIVWMWVDENGQVRAFNPEYGFFGVAPGTGDDSNPNAMKAIGAGSGTIYTNVAVNVKTKQVWWEGKGPKPTDLDGWLDWQGIPISERAPEDMNKPWAQPNSRFTTPINKLDVRSPEWDSAAGVPVSMVIWGGRVESFREKLIRELRSPEEGVYDGWNMIVERTAAIEGQGVVRDATANFGFFSAPEGEYAADWLRLARQGNLRFFHVNWFQKDASGGFRWPGYENNIRALAWAVDRVHGRGEAVETPVGYLPTLSSLNLEGLDLSPADLEKLIGFTSEDIELWQREMARRTAEMTNDDAQLDERSKLPREIWRAHEETAERLQRYAVNQAAIEQVSQSIVDSYLPGSDRNLNRVARVEPIEVLVEGAPISSEDYATIGYYLSYLIHGHGVAAFDAWRYSAVGSPVGKFGDKVATTAFTRWYNFLAFVLGTQAAEGARDEAATVEDLYGLALLLNGPAPDVLYASDPVEVTERLQSDPYLANVTIAAYALLDLYRKYGVPVPSLNLPDEMYMLGVVGPAGSGVDVELSAEAFVPVNMTRAAAARNKSIEQVRVTGVLLRERHMDIINDTLAVLGVRMSDLPENVQGFFQERDGIAALADKAAVTKFKDHVKKNMAGQVTLENQAGGSLRLVTDGDLMPVMEIATGRADLAMGAGGTAESMIKVRMGYELIDYSGTPISYLATMDGKADAVQATSAEARFLRSEERKGRIVNEVEIARNAGLTVTEIPAADGQPSSFRVDTVFDKATIAGGAHNVSIVASPLGDATGSNDYVPELKQVEILNGGSEVRITYLVVLPGGRTVIIPVVYDTGVAVRLERLTQQMRNGDHNAVVQTSFELAQLYGDMKLYDFASRSLATASRAIRRIQQESLREVLNQRVNALTEYYAGMRDILTNPRAKTDEVKQGAIAHFEAAVRLGYPKARMMLDVVQHGEPQYTHINVAYVLERVMKSQGDARQAAVDQLLAFIREASSTERPSVELLLHHLSRLPDSSASKPETIRLFAGIIRSALANPNFGAQIGALLAEISGRSGASATFRAIAEVEIETADQSAQQNQPKSAAFSLLAGAVSVAGMFASAQADGAALLTAALGIFGAAHLLDAALHLIFSRGLFSKANEAALGISRFFLPVGANQGGLLVGINAHFIEHAPDFLRRALVAYETSPLQRTWYGRFTLRIAYPALIAASALDSRKFAAWSAQLRLMDAKIEALGALQGEELNAAVADVNAQLGSIVDRAAAAPDTAVDDAEGILRLTRFIGMLSALNDGASQQNAERLQTLLTKVFGDDLSVALLPAVREQTSRFDVRSQGSAVSDGRRARAISDLARSLGIRGDLAQGVNRAFERAFNIGYAAGQVLRIPAKDRVQPAVAAESLPNGVQVYVLPEAGTEQDSYLVPTLSLKLARAGEADRFVIAGNGSEKTVRNQFLRLIQGTPSAKALRQAMQDGRLRFANDPSARLIRVPVITMKLQRMGLSTVGAQFFADDIERLVMSLLELGRVHVFKMLKDNQVAPVEVLDDKFQEAEEAQHFRMQA